MDDQKKPGGYMDDISLAELDKKNKTIHKDAEDDSEPSLEPVPFLQLYRFSTPGDRVILLVATVAAIIGGAVFPVSNIVFGAMVKLMVKRDFGEIECNGTVPISPSSTPPSLVSSTATTKPDIYDEMIKVSFYMIALGGVQIVSGYFFVSLFNRVAENMIFRLREVYLEALLRQDIGWYDTTQDRNFVSKVSEAIGKVKEAVGEKAGLCVFYFFNGVFSLIIALYHGWLLTLVILSSSPVIAAASTIVSSFQARMAVKEQKAYTESGSIAQEVLANIKTVMAFSGQGKEINRFEGGLVNAISAGKSRSFVSAIGNGILWFLNYVCYALAFWYGTKLILEGENGYCEEEPAYTAGTLFTIFFCVLLGSVYLGQGLAYLEVFSIGRGAAASIYKVIDRVPAIDSYADSGINPKGRLTGEIEFLDVRFSYPSRQDVEVLQGLSIKIKPGSTVAFVGNSGCGKSTCLQLLQRFYDPNFGSVLVDGNNIKDYNINWYRSQLGVVSQEPVLFNTTIAENIRYGREGVSQAEIEQACRLANAHNFISRLPQKYETEVGERGAQMSGGQKQRIAIARALVRNPAILLLDEATSALDTQSESVVQEALDKARLGRTTLIVAHRLSTIRTADVIVSIKNGQVVEVGTHEELIGQKGVYFQLVTAQMGEVPTEEDDSHCSEHGEEQSDSSPKKSAIPEEDIVDLVAMAAPSDTDKEVAKSTSFFSLLKLNAKEWPLLATGIVMSIAHGCVLPVYSYYFGEFLGVLSLRDTEEAQKEANYYCVIFLIIGVFAGLTIFASLACFGAAGTILTNRLRLLSFKSMLQQELAWYDDSGNSVGALCSRLSGDAASIQGATGGILGIIVQSLTTIIVSACLGLYVMPRLGAVALAFAPVILIAVHYNGKIMEDQDVKEKAATEEASKLAFQAVSNIRTVASLCKERDFVAMYCAALIRPHKKALTQSHMLGFVYGLSQSMLFVAYGTVMYYGSILIRDENLDYKSIFVSVLTLCPMYTLAVSIGEALIWSMLMLGNTLAFAPNYNKAKVAGGRILRLLHRTPAIVNSPGVGLQIKNCQGSVMFDKTEFHYPTRPQAKILKGLTFGIEPTLNIGVCGPSGSGKSTCVQLILRYYDPTMGRVLLDEIDVGALNVHALRSQMAIVSQEPALFDRTMADNIAYGDNSRAVEMSEIIEAARSANIHDFIASLPAGYSTRVGDMGAQLSGGQKQRVAIARALIRNPKLLLLDEATSALDTGSEKIVQAALDNASTGRTCITIAHRLSSIQNADRILVINGGRLSESGTHAELLQKHGIYHKLWNMQRH